MSNEGISGKMNWDSYYEITSSSIIEEEYSFEIRIKPDCDVYRGHFPGHPISPGVCNIGMIRDLAGKALKKKIRFTSIKQCRLTGMITPESTPALTVTLNLTSSDDGCSVSADIKDTEKSYMELKGEAIYV